MPPAWRKSPAWLVEIFERGFPMDPRAERRSMFGYPSGFVNGNMFAGLFQESLFVRLDEAGRAELLAIEGAALFEPMPGRPMREYVVLPAELLEDGERVKGWIDRALTHAAALPAKGAGKAKAKAAKVPPRKPASPKALKAPAKLAIVRAKVSAKARAATAAKSR